MLNVIGVIHAFIFLYGFYPLLIPASKFYDKVYLLYTIIISLNWSIFKGECYISYLWKKLENPDYIMGSNVFDMSDIKSIFPSVNSYFVENSMIYLILFIQILFVYTAIRSKLLPISLSLLYLVITSFVLFRVRKFYNKKLHDRLEKYMILDFLNILSIVILIYIMYIIWNK